jgi:hypothetical protein
MLIDNVICSTCGKPFHKKASALNLSDNHFCSKSCYYTFKTKPGVACICCGKLFQSCRSSNRCCSKSCATKMSRKAWSTKSNGIPKGKYRSKLSILQEKFVICSCMIQGCEYNKTFDVHRLINGKDGGLYEIGNMFAICPNHHAEIHRGLTVVEKVSDTELKIKED